MSSVIVSPDCTCPGFCQMCDLEIPREETTHSCPDCGSSSIHYAACSGDCEALAREGVDLMLSDVLKGSDFVRVAEAGSTFADASMDQIFVGRGDFTFDDAEKMLPSGDGYTEFENAGDSVNVISGVRSYVIKKATLGEVCQALHGDYRILHVHEDEDPISSYCEIADVLSDDDVEFVCGGHARSFSDVDIDY